MKKKIFSLTRLLVLLLLCVVTSVVVLAVGNDGIMLLDDTADITIQFMYDPNIEGETDGSLPEPMKINLSGEESLNEFFVLQQMVGYEASVITDRLLVKGDALEDNVANISIATVNGRKGVKFDNYTIDSGKLPLQFYVYYEPVDVNYTVRYYFQNANNDEYTEITALAKSGQAKTGTIFSDLELAAMIEDDPNLPENFETGYRLLHAIPDMVAADGSTVFQTYYDRQYFTIDFELDDGYGVEPIYERYGANIVVGIPVKPGYIFDGWEKVHSDGYDTVPATVPNTNLKYRAKWTPNPSGTTYTVAYWAYDATGAKYLLDTKTVTGAVPGATASGKDDFTSSIICNIPEHSHDASCGVDTSHTTHSSSCGVPATFETTTVSGNDEAAIDKLATLPNGALESGYVYAIQTYDDIFSYGNRYWLKYHVDGQWYQASGALSESALSNYVDLDQKVATTYPNNGVNNFYVHKYAIKSGVLPGCPAGCGIQAHTHTENCKINSHYLTYLESDQNLAIKGDGATVVNVYYTHKNYTLRFYYARSYQGTDNSTVYQVVGGSTWPFGTPKNTTAKTDLETALEEVGSDQWGVVSQPVVDADYLAQKDAMNKNYFSTGTDTFSNGGVDYTYYYFEFTAPYGSDISSLWPVDMFNTVEIQSTHTTHTAGTTAETNKCKYGNYAYFSAWNGEDRVKYTKEHDNPTIKGKYTILDENLIFSAAYEDSQVEYIDAAGRSSYLVNYLCFWENGADVSWSVPKEFTYNIYKENPATGQYDLSDTFHVYDDSNPGSQTAMTIKGYEYVRRESQKISADNAVMEKYRVDFYYDLVDDQIITFKNEGQTIKEVKDHYFGELLKDCLGDFDPTNPQYPSTLESNAYEFLGWCTSYPCSTDTIINFNTYQIPENNVILYAFWQKKTYEVTFKDAYDGTTIATYPDIVHGNSLGVAIADPEDDDDHFAGWFYMDGATKKKFDPMVTPIDGNLEVFATWEGTTPREYTIRFVTMKNGVEVEIAAPITGVARQNSTKTFLAKGGSSLYAGYQTKYYPTTQSHSIVIAEEDNVYTFEYFYVETDLNYTVRYVDAATGLNLPINEDGIVNGEITKFVSASYVTENYYPYSAYYVPDSFKKSLVLSVKQNANGDYVSDDEKNVIIFEYTKQAEKTGYYIVNFYLEKLGNTAATLTTENCDFRTSIESASKIQAVQLDIPSFVGFRPVSQSGGTSLDTGNMKIRFDVEEDGTEVNVFYERLSYGCTVKLTNGTDTKVINLPDQEYGAMVTYDLTDADKKYFPGYKPNTLTASVTITEDEAQNVIAFQYDPIQYEIRYEAKTFDSGVQQTNGTKGGTLSLNAENTYYGVSEFMGSTATAKTHYRFAGWFRDAACTDLVTDENKLEPQVAWLDENEATCFYAKFVRLTANLTITRTNVQDEEQVFVYKVTDVETDEVIFVTIRGAGSVTIRDMFQGEYTVEQQNTWSWRYPEESANCSLTGNATVVFDDAVEEQQWLNANSPENAG